MELTWDQVYRHSLCLPLTLPLSLSLSQATFPLEIQTSSLMVGIDNIVIVNVTGSATVVCYSYTYSHFPLRVSTIGRSTGIVLSIEFAISHSQPCCHWRSQHHHSVCVSLSSALLSCLYFVCFLEINKSCWHNHAGS